MNFSRVKIKIIDQNHAQTLRIKKVPRLENYDEWEYIITIDDWVSINSGKLLTEHKILFKLSHLWLPLPLKGS